MISLAERDRLDLDGADPVWVGAITFECHGALVGVRADHGDALDAARHHPPTGASPRPLEGVNALYSWTTSDSDTSGNKLHVIQLRCALRGERTKEIARTTDLRFATALLKHDAEFRIAVHSPDHVFVHAGAVAWRGRVIVIPGHSYAGKSTLTAALVRAGAEYLSDEYTIIDSDGLVRAFPRRLHLRGTNRKSFRAVSVQDLGGVAAGSPMPLGMVVYMKYREGARWRPRHMTPGQAALALVDNAIAARVRPAHVMERIALAMKHGAVGFQSARGDAGETARRILHRASRTFAAPTTG